MNIPLLVVTIFLYWWIAGGCVFQRDFGHGLMWFAYGLANIGLIIYELKKVQA